MNINQFSKSIAKNLQKHLNNMRVTCKQSNSCVASNSHYIEIVNDDTGEYFDIKISDHFNKGTCAFNLDIKGLKLNAEESVYWSNEIINRFNTI
jgi:hypothetical protein